MKRKVFDGEFISAEKGTEEPFGSVLVWDILKKVHLMKDGDTIVINAHEEEVSL